MDRDQRWERVAPAYALLVDGDGAFEAASAEAGLAAAYARGESDEFVKPTAIVDARGRLRMADGDVVVFMNFRADRAREMTRALTDAAFNGFTRARVPRLARFVCLTHYGDEFRKLDVAFAPQIITNSFGEYLASRNLHQLRIAETEKYAHVTYFFNGGSEAVYPGEERILVPSPKVATYDLKPEMSAVEVTDRLVDAIGSGRYDAIVCNYANADMVGHTGDFDAARRAIETLDACIGRVVDAARSQGGEVVITADHGNAEQLLEPDGVSPFTAHTTNPVPVVVTVSGRTLRAGGELADLAPTCLDLLGFSAPEAMQGRSLLNVG
jgi:2,3-bisphosphoglycerate-independent phosphoglycerate mutase